jgi:putative restriction endonuclease
MNIADRIQSLADPRHRKGLEWFLAHAGQTLSVPKCLPDGTILHEPAGGGMYVPRDSKYVLSLKSSHNANEDSIYRDFEPTKTSNGWRYRYQHVNIGGPTWKNQRLQANIDDAVPAGAFRQVPQKIGGITQYEVLGVAFVTLYDVESGYFEMESAPAQTEELTSNYNRPNVEEDLRRWKETQQAIREGQADFRKELIKAYQGRCAITGYDLELALDAAHVRRYNGRHTNFIQNGLLLRKDLHKLFDHGVFGIRPEDLSVTINDRARNSMYSELSSLRLTPPSAPGLGPDLSLLAEHLRTWNLS